MAKQEKKKRTRQVIPAPGGFIISNPAHARQTDNVQLLRITVTALETKFDFGYQATSYYINGGWIKISPKTFIRLQGSNKKLLLTNATNIPYGPEKLHFNSSIEWRYFSLHFPSILSDLEKASGVAKQSLAPSTYPSIDLIEQENGSDTDFNFLGIRLDEEGKRVGLY